MTLAIRPRRSVLYMPGSNPRALEKARDLPCDGLVFDLEDAVTPAKKVEAREIVRAALAAGGYGARERLIRINGPGTTWAIADTRLVTDLFKLGAVDGVLLPKVDDPAIVRGAEAAFLMAQAPEVPIWCMIETPRGVLRAAEIAASSPRVAGFVMGTSDLVKDLGARHAPDRAPLIAALSWCVLVARAHDIAILDGVHLDLADEEGFAAVCRQGRDMGFDGKTLIHPKTIAAANAAFGPDPAELDWARRIAAAHARAEAEGKGVLLVDGKLVEALHVDQARRLVALAEAIAARGSSAA